MTLTIVQTAMAGSSESTREQGFPMLARRYYEPVYRFLVRQSPSREDAADLTQEVFLKAHQAFARFDGSREFAPWIFTIARRSLADFYRRRSQDSELEEDRLTEPSANPREQILEKEEEQEIWQVSGSLKPRLNQVLLLHYKEGFSIKETARVMGISATYTKVLLFRARAALKEKLSRQPFIGGNDQ